MNYRHIKHRPCKHTRANIILCMCTTCWVALSTEEDDADKQMGDTGPGAPEQLDRNMWAPEEDKGGEVWNSSTTTCIFMNSTCLLG